MQIFLFKLERATMGRSDWQMNEFAEQNLYYIFHSSLFKGSGLFLNCPMSFFPFSFSSPKCTDFSSCNRKYLTCETKFAFPHVLSFSSLLLSKPGSPDLCVKATEPTSHRKCWEQAEESTQGSVLILI